MHDVRKPQIVEEAEAAYRQSIEAASSPATGPEEMATRDLSVLSLALSAFRGDPLNVEYMLWLVNASLSPRGYLRDLGELEVHLDDALLVEKNRNLVGLKIAEVLGAIPENEGDGVNLLVLTSVAEKLYEVSDDPMHAVNLGAIYSIIGRYADALILFETVAKSDSKYAPHFINTCFTFGKFEELIAYWEQYQPEVGRKEKIRVAMAYQGLREGEDEWSDEIDYIRHGSKQEDLAKAQKATRLLATMYTAPVSEASAEELENAVNYAQALLNEAEIMETLRDGDKKPAAIKKLRQIGGAILKNVMSHFEEIEGTSGENCPEVQIAAMYHLVALGSSHLQTIPDGELAKYIEMADRVEEARAHDLLYHGDVIMPGREHAIPSVMAKLCANSADLSRKALVEVHLLEAMEGNWNDAEAYFNLMRYYEQHRPEDVPRVKRYLSLAAILDNLIRVDTHGKSFTNASTLNPEHILGPNEIEEYLENYDQVIKDVEAGNLFLTPYFTPIIVALTPLISKYMNYLSTIVPDDVDISHRIKNPASVLLKFLKIGMKNTPFVSDIIGFRILTDTEEEAVAVAEALREDIARDNDDDVWHTFFSPTRAGYRSFDISGNSGAAGTMVDVQVRPKSVEQQIKRGQARHEKFKVNSGLKLREHVDNNSLRHLDELMGIMKKLATAYEEITTRHEAMELRDVLRVYRKQGLPLGKEAE